MTEHEIKDRIGLLEEGMKMLGILARGFDCRWILALHDAAAKRVLELRTELRKGGE